MMFLVSLCWIAAGVSIACVFLVRKELRHGKREIEAALLQNNAEQVRRVEEEYANHSFALARQTHSSIDDVKQATEIAFKAVQETTEEWAQGVRDNIARSVSEAHAVKLAREEIARNAAAQDEHPFLPDAPGEA